MTAWTPARAPREAAGYRWRVEVSEWGVLLVDLSTDEAATTGMAPHELADRLPAALQRYAAVKLDDEAPVLDQLDHWESPVTLRAEHFNP